MTFPRTAPGLLVELYYSGVWHDITADVNALDGIRINRGRAAEGQDIDPARCSLTLRNPTGKYSPRNMSSSLYGLIGRNTPIRVSVEYDGVWYYRFWGEVAAWPQKWGPKGSPQSMAPIECAGIMRRLGQGASPVRSTLYRGTVALGTTLVAYWPMEDAPGSSTLAPARGTRAGRVFGSATLGAYDEFHSSEAIPKPGSGGFSLLVDPYTNTTEWQVRFIGNIPAATPNNAILARIYTNNSMGWADLVYTTGGNLTLKPYTNAGVAMTAVGPTAFAVDGKDLYFDVEAHQSGGSVLFKLATVAPGANTGLVSADTNVGAATLGAVTRVDINPDGYALGDLALGHLTVENDITSLFTLGAPLNAWNGERVTDRLTRLCAENGITFGVSGDDSASPRLGYQGRGTLVDLLQEAASIGRGFLYEQRGAYALGYRALPYTTTLTAATCSVEYSDNLLLPFEPVDDDQATRNRVTVTREGGASATVEDDSSRMGTAAPPAGVGIYDEAVTLSLADDIAAKHHAGWRVHMGTVDEARWPQIGMDLAHPSFVSAIGITGQPLDLSMGDRLDVTSLPDWLPPDPVQAVVQGYSEEITYDPSGAVPFHHRLVFNCSPFRPYRAARYKATGIVDRYSNDNTVLAEDLTLLETGADVSFSAGPAWTHADGDFEVMIGGERMLVTAVSGTSSPQTFTVTRGISGWAKTHAAGEKVTLYDPTFYGL